MAAFDLPRLRKAWTGHKAHLRYWQVPLDAPAHSKELRSAVTPSRKEIFGVQSGRRG